MDTKKARVLAVIAGHETPAATRTVSLVVNGKVIATKKVDVPANGRATVVFEGLDVPYGESRCAVRIDAADGFPNDDASNFAVKRADPERVLFVHQGSDARSPLYFGAALAAAAQASFVLQPITPEQASDIDPTKYAFVVLSDVPSVPSILEHTLSRNVEDGGSVLVATGMADSHREHIPVYGGNVADGHFYARGSLEDAGFYDRGRGGRVAPVDEGREWLGGDEVLLCRGSRSRAGASGGAAGGWDAAADRQADGRGPCAAVCVGLRQPDQRSAAEPGVCRVCGPDGAIPVGRRAGERGAGGGLVCATAQSGECGVGGGASKAAGATVDIVGPDGKRPLTLKEAAAAESFQLAHAGFYQIQFANGRDALIAVNPDPARVGFGRRFRTMC